MKPLASLKLLAALLSLGLAHAAQAATITVSNTNDAGAGSLRDTIASAAPGDTIDFAVTGTITLTSGQLLIDKNLTIQGPGANLLTVSGNQASRVFEINSGVTATLDSVTVANGSSSLGGGISNNGGTLNITNSTLSGNSASGGSFNFGGGIYNLSGTVNITNSTLSGNSAIGGSSTIGGGIYNVSGNVTITNSTLSGNSASGVSVNQGGGIFTRNSGTVNITNSSLSGNSASGGTTNQGGGIYSSNGAQLTITNSTLSGNGASSSGGGIYRTGPGFVRSRNTIIAGNTAATSPDVFGSSFSSQGYNLIGKSDGSSGFTNGVNGDQVGTTASPIDPKLAALANNGGPTKTHALLPGSPAINGGDPAFSPSAFTPPLNFDQRGSARVFGGRIDIGAYESADTDGDGVEDFRDNCPTTPNPEKIAFTSVRDGNQEIYVMNADGSNPINLTNNPAADYEPSFSGNGARIVFTSLRGGDLQIWVMNADGSNPTPLTNNAAQDNFAPSFSRDGSKITFVSDRDGHNSQVYVMNADGSNQTRLTNSSATDDTPSFSPDGSKIVFSSRVLSGSTFQIYVMNADGSNLTALTNIAAANRKPSFSPDGTKIVFSRGDGIYVMNADGSNATNLTNNPAAIDRGPSFSPDGSKIAFSSNRDGNFEVYVMNADGSNPTRLTNNPDVDSEPSWGHQADSVGNGIGDVCRNTAPTITGASGVSREQDGGGTYLSIAAVNDAQDAKTALSVTVNGSASANANGVTISNIAVDASGNVTANVAAACGASNAAFTLRVTDSGALFAETPLNIAVTTETKPPVITLTGANLMTVECHAAFTDSGATASDNCAGSVPVTASGSVDANTPGSYTLTYNAVDPSGNPAASVTRTVNVVDTAPPVITLIGANPITVECSANFTDPGATASDTCAGNLTSAIVRTGSINTGVPGTYTLTYNVQDPSAHAAVPVTRTVKVVDTTAPVITAVTANPGTLWPADNKLKPVTVAVSATDCGVVTSKITSVSFLDPGKGDKEDEAGKKMKPAVQITGDLSVKLLAGPKGRVYTITVTCTDSAGNAATKTMAVTVAPPPPPPPPPPRH